MERNTNDQLARDEDLFFEHFVGNAVSRNPRFLRRTWLADRIDEKLSAVGQRFVLLTAEPGAGKSAFMAQLAHDNPGWLRYFIRRDQRSVLSDVSDKSLLLRIGYQLAARRPELFDQDQLLLSVEMDLGDVGRRGEVIGAEIERLTASPFYRKVVEIRQQIEQNQGRVVGLHVDELVVETRLLSSEDLLQLALIHPARTLQRIDPNQQIVILIDALDEIRYHNTAENILSWLIGCPALPANIRFVLTSRPPDEYLRLFCEKQAENLTRLAIREEDPNVRADVERFTDALIREPGFVEARSLLEGGVQSFREQVIRKAHGNLGYLDALARGVDQAIETKAPQSLQALLSLSELPGDLEGLYAFFLHQIKVSVVDERVELEDPETGESYDKPVWPAIYSRLLGVLAVALEPLDIERIIQLSGIRTEHEWVQTAIDRLRQFLDLGNGCYRFYHGTVAEFLTAVTTKVHPHFHDLYQDGAACHRRILRHYQRRIGDLFRPQWSRIDSYGWRHLLAHAEFSHPDTPTLALFQICDAGFLEAKGLAGKDALELEDDRSRAMGACQAVDDYVRFIRYGLQFAYQFMDVSPLENSVIAQTAMVLAIRQGGSDAIERLVAMVAIIDNVHTRLWGQLAFLDELAAAENESRAVETLRRAIESELAMLDPGEERDAYFVSYVRIMARFKPTGWVSKAQGYLGEVESFLARVKSQAAFSEGLAEERMQGKASELLNDALEACEQIDVTGETDILEMFAGVERVLPSDQIADALAVILAAAQKLTESGCSEIVERARREIVRINEETGRLVNDDTTRLRLEVLAIETLDKAGLKEVARQDSWAFLDAYYRAGQPVTTTIDSGVLSREVADAVGRFEFGANAETAVMQLLLSPVLIQAGDSELLEQWHRAFGGYLLGVESPGDLINVADTVVELADKDALRPMLFRVFQQIELRAENMKLDEEDKFDINAILADGYAMVGERQRSYLKISEILGKDTRALFDSLAYKEAAQRRTRVLLVVWQAACRCDEQDIVQRTFEWLQREAYSCLMVHERKGVWLGAFEYLRNMSDHRLAVEIFGWLKRQSVEDVEPIPFLAAALRQYADAYTQLGDAGIAKMLLQESNDLIHQMTHREATLEIRISIALAYAKLGEVDPAVCLSHELLEDIQSLDGDDDRSYYLVQCLRILDALANFSSDAKSAAASMLEKFDKLAESFALEEYRFWVLAELAKCAAAYSFAEPVEKAAARLEGYEELQPDHGVLQVLSSLYLIGFEDRAEVLLKRVEAWVESLPREDDFQLADICRNCEALIDLYVEIDRAGETGRWRKLAKKLADKTMDPTARTRAFCHLVRLETNLANHEVAPYLSVAVDAWSKIDEPLFADKSASMIFNAWQAIGDLEERWRCVDIVRDIFRRETSILERDAWYARIASCFEQDKARYRELISTVTTQGGIGILLYSLRDANSIDPHLLPEALYTLLNKTGRLSRLAFAGYGLSATEAAVRHRTFAPDVSKAALSVLEGTMREVLENRPSAV